MTPTYEDVFMLAALQEAEVALHEGEVPVGCVVVRTDSERLAQSNCCSSLAGKEIFTSSFPSSSLDVEKRIIARGRNATNKRHHALAHAEFIAMEVLQKESQTIWHVEVEDKGLEKNSSDLKEENVLLEPSSVIDHYLSEDSSLPLYLEEVVVQTIPCALYVTVEPCIMCAAMLRYNQCTSLPSTCGETIGIKEEGSSGSSFSEVLDDSANERRENALQELDTKRNRKMMCVKRFYAIQHVFYGCGNPRFGGNGSVLSLHNDTWGKVQKEHLCSSSSRSRSKKDGSEECVSYFPLEGEGIVEPKPYVSEGGHRKEEAIALLQEFYKRENASAPGHKRRRKPTTMAKEMLDSGEGGDER